MFACPSGSVRHHHRQSSKGLGVCKQASTFHQEHRRAARPRPGQPNPGPCQALQLLATSTSAWCPVVWWVRCSRVPSGPLGCQQQIIRSLRFRPPRPTPRTGQPSCGGLLDCSGQGRCCTQGLHPPAHRQTAFSLGARPPRSPPVRLPRSCRLPPSRLPPPPPHPPPTPLSTETCLSLLSVAVHLLTQVAATHAPALYPSPVARRCCLLASSPPLLTLLYTSRRCPVVVSGLFSPSFSAAKPSASPSPPCRGNPAIRASPGRRPQLDKTSTSFPAMALTVRSSRPTFADTWATMPLYGLGITRYDGAFDLRLHRCRRRVTSFKRVIGLTLCSLDIRTHRPAKSSRDTTSQPTGT